MKDAIAFGLMVAAFLAVWAAAPANAQQYYQYNDYNAGGGIHYYSDNQGNTASSYSSGNGGPTYYSNSRGQHCSSMQYGSQTSVSCY